MECERTRGQQCGFQWKWREWPPTDWKRKGGVENCRERERKGSYGEMESVKEVLM